MTANSFYMDVTSETVSIDCKDCDMRVTTEIPVDDFAFALLKTNDNLDYLAKPVKDELIQRAVNEWDIGLSGITDEDLSAFKKVLEVIL